MSNRTLLERNLLAITSQDPVLGSRLGKAKPAEYIQFTDSRKGPPVPGIVQNNRFFPFHSTFDPEKEGARFFAQNRESGFLVFLGLGGGYHITPFLELKSVSQILIIEKDISFVRKVIETLDLRQLLTDRRVRFLIDPTPDEVNQYLISHYLPAVYGNLSTLSLRSRYEKEKKYFSELFKKIREVINILADDYTVQAYFGKKWFSNTVANLKAAETTYTQLKPRRKALVTGAGPSLETQIDKIKELREKAMLIATDTSLPALRHFDILPDIVITIDCQTVTYHHFLSGCPEEVPLVLDLASPPVIARLTSKRLFFSSGHPLSQYVTRNWRRFPSIDISGGNVSHAAISLASYIGADTIHLFGTDFSYPKGKAYSRGTYIYPFFRSKEHRFSPLEDLFFSFMLRGSKVVKEDTGDFIRYTTKPMISYKKRLENSIEDIPAQVIPEKGLGLEIQVKQNLEKDQRFSSSLFTAGKARSSWRDFLFDYAKHLKSLPEPVQPLPEYFSRLNPEDQDVWTTIFPTLAVYSRLDNDTSPPVTRLKEAREWSLEVIARVLRDYK
ncbi:MAG: motility associated factor glycosyltransferase family protein [Spirochaetia bacterium]